METHIDLNNLGTTLKERAKAKYKEANLLYKEVNNENKISRNSRCKCGSGKKWKRCCLLKHEEKTLELEQKVQEYKGLCVELRRKK